MEMEEKRSQKEEREREGARGGRVDSELGEGARVRSNQGGRAC